MQWASVGHLLCASGICMHSAMSLIMNVSKASLLTYLLGSHLEAGPLQSLIRQCTGIKSREKNLWDADSSSSDDLGPTLTGSAGHSRRSLSAGVSLRVCQCGLPDEASMLRCVDCHKRYHQECCDFTGTGAHSVYLAHALTGHTCQQCTFAQPQPCPACFKASCPCVWLVAGLYYMR